MRDEITASLERCVRIRPAACAARAVAALLHELRGERAASDRVALQAAEEAVGAGTARKTPWLARRAARREERDQAFRWLEYGVDASRAATTVQLLEARCEIVAELELWDLDKEAIADARRFAELALVDALPLYADRLERRAALAGGDLDLALHALTRAREGFAALDARWDEAVTCLWLAEAKRATGADDQARAEAERALRVFDELRSVRELEHARSLLAGS